MTTETKAIELIPLIDPDYGSVGFYAMGHHDPAAFCAAADEHFINCNPKFAPYAQHVGKVQHAIWKVHEPDEEDEDTYVEAAEPGDVGAFEVTTLDYEDLEAQPAGAEVRP